MIIAAQFFWLAPALPLVVFVLLTAGLSRAARLAAWTLVTVLASSTIVAAAGLAAAAGGSRLVISVPWISVGQYRLELALWLEPLSALMATLVAVIGFIVAIYATAYMQGDRNAGRFFAEIALFVGSMLALVMAADLITLFVAWELVGACSYLLIGFWFEKPEVSGPATKALVTTRIADLALLAGILLLAGIAASTRIDAVLGSVAAGKVSNRLLSLIALLIFTGAAGKSAQIPFQGWLPDAMVGPTPVSALLHSATMVAAGVFLIARLYPLFEAAAPVLPAIAWIGVTTALLGAAAALVQTDLKRTLAYSTMSQLGLMFAGLGAGSLLAGVLLLIAQALYKSTLFLAAGAVEHAVEGKEFEYMGGLARRMPVTFVVSAISAAALAGVPVTLALPPKDLVLAAAWKADTLLFGLTVTASSVLTALYSGRMLGLVFLGPASEAGRHAREARSGLILPTAALGLLVLAGLLADAALLGRPLSHLLRAGPVEHGVVTALALAVALIGMAAGLWARFAWPGAIIWPPLARLVPALRGELGLVRFYQILAALTHWSTARMAAFDQVSFDRLSPQAAKAVRIFVQRTSAVDRRVFDATAEAAARGTLTFIRATSAFDVRRLEGRIAAFAQSLLDFSQASRRLQTGRVENYLLAIFAWGLAIVLFAIAL